MACVYMIYAPFWIGIGKTSIILIEVKKEQIFPLTVQFKKYLKDAFDVKQKIYLTNQLAC